MSKKRRYKKTHSRHQQNKLERKLYIFKKQTLQNNTSIISFQINHTVCFVCVWLDNSCVSKVCWTILRFWTIKSFNNLAYPWRVKFSLTYCCCWAKYFHQATSYSSILQRQSWGSSICSRTEKYWHNCNSSISFIAVLTYFDSPCIIILWTLNLKIFTFFNDFSPQYKM